MLQYHILNNTSNFQPKEIKFKFNLTIIHVFTLILVTSCQLACIKTDTLVNGAIHSNSAPPATLGDANFTFIHNGSFIMIDAGREWPLNSKREISFKFKTKSPHGLLLYQTFDYGLPKEHDDQELPVVSASAPDRLESKPGDSKQTKLTNRLKTSKLHNDLNDQVTDSIRDRRFIDSKSDRSLAISSLDHEATSNTASAKLANSIFSLSLAAPINGNDVPPKLTSNLPKVQEDLEMISNLIQPVKSTKKGDTMKANPIHRMSLRSDAIGLTSPAHEAQNNLASVGTNQPIASLYEMYLKLENGRLKITYEFESRLNQTYCGKGLNDDRWHRIDLRVDPELNQMALILDQSITVDIILSQTPSEDDMIRKSDPNFTRSVLYLGGLDNRAVAVRGIKEKLHMAQFIGCIGQIMIKTDHSVETIQQPVRIARLAKTIRGCLNRCYTEDYCLHNSNCINYYTHAHCDCFKTNYEDTYCWNNNLTTLSMLGHSLLAYRVYDWRDRHHMSNNRLSIEFKTLALDSILFFAYGEISSQANFRFSPLQSAYPSTIIQNQPIPLPSSQVNASNYLNMYRPPQAQIPSTSNYLAVSLSNGSLVVELNFGDQAIIMSNLLYDRLLLKPPILSDGQWHRVTLQHRTKQVMLTIDEYSFNHTITTKYHHFYFDPAIYFGAVPNLLSNETKLLTKTINLRHKFVGCFRSIYFNQHNILLDLKKSSQAVEYRDPLGKPLLNTCVVRDPGWLPISLRSGKSYLTFQLIQNPYSSVATYIRKSDLNQKSDKLMLTSNATDQLKSLNVTVTSKRQIKIEFEYKTSQRSYFLAGGHLKDSSYHDLGGFWTLYAIEDCQLYFTISSGLTYEPEQVMKLENNDNGCDPDSWFKFTISMISGDQAINMTRTKVVTPSNSIEEYDNSNETTPEMSIYTLKSSLELLHQVQLGGDLAKFGGSSSVPFSGCLRNIKINDRLHDSREFVTQSATSSQPINSNFNLTQVTNQASPDVISNRIAQGFITLDSCQLVNPCYPQNPCKNNGTCKVNDSGDVECDCSKTGYTGKRCHFSIHKQSCLDLYLSGQRKSSYYLIDVDRNGPLRPIRVRCTMHEDVEQIETSISHNLPPEFLVHQSETQDFFFDITYLSFYHMLSNDGFYYHNNADDSALINQDAMLRAVIAQSLNCKQSFRYDCRSAPFELGNKTWLVAPYPENHKVMSLDSVNRGRCMCASTQKKCLDPSKNCNCDSSEPFWADDSYEFSGKDHVGITKIVILKRTRINKQRDSQDLTFKLESQSRFTLGDLRCMGSVLNQNQYEITFKTSDAYIEVPGWRKGDISFSFRTASNPPAIILYQLATSRNHGYFRLTLISDTRLLFEFVLNRKPRKLNLNSIHKLNNGEWQQVFIEYDPYNLRITVNDESVMVDLEFNDYLGTFEGPLFIGGAPSKYLAGDSSKRNGFTGCFRGLTIAERTIDLGTYLSPLMPTVTSGCKPSCTKNLCQNGGKCIEYWGSYECECSNPLAHSGMNCEINLNTNSITFISQKSYYMQIFDENSSYYPYLVKNILLNIRTYQETSLILYANDHLNNFIQLHKNASYIALSFNSNDTIVTLQVLIDGEQKPSSNQLNTGGVKTVNFGKNDITSLPLFNTTITPTSNQDQKGNPDVISGNGQPIQIKIERHRLRTTLYVNNNFATVESPMILMNNYSSWSNPDMKLIRKIRLKNAIRSRSQVFLGNVDEGQYSTRLPGFTGCIQGLIIDNQLFDFNRAHLIGEFKGDYKIGCKMHCDSFPCKNQGICVENWKEERISCKCHETSYVGNFCDEDVAAIFNGQSSYFIYNLTSQTPSSEPMSKTSNKLTDSSIGTSQTNEPSRVDGMSMNTLPARPASFLDITFAFSTDTTGSEANQSLSNPLQVLMLMKWANSSAYFFLGLSPDGSLIAQENHDGPEGKHRFLINYLT